MCHQFIAKGKLICKEQAILSLIVLFPILPSLSCGIEHLSKDESLGEQQSYWKWNSFFFLFHRLGPVLETEGHLFSDFMQMSGSRSPCLDVMLSFCLWNFPCLLFYMSCHCLTTFNTESSRIPEELHAMCLPLSCKILT